MFSQFKTLGEDGCKSAGRPVQEVWPIIDHVVTSWLRNLFRIDQQPIGPGRSGQRVRGAREDRGTVELIIGGGDWSGLGRRFASRRDDPVATAPTRCRCTIARDEAGPSGTPTRTKFEPAGRLQPGRVVQRAPGQIDRQLGTGRWSASSTSGELSRPTRTAAASAPVPSSATRDRRRALRRTTPGRRLLRADVEVHEAPSEDRSSPVEGRHGRRLGTRRAIRRRHGGGDGKNSGIVDGRVDWSRQGPTSSDARLSCRERWVARRPGSVPSGAARILDGAQASLR
jgi:hypothetical protein